jgi:hypothetical protein
VVDVKQLVLLIGVGRSGTSAFTGILRELGFHVPQPEVEPDETNPRGFGEPRWVVDWHTRLLKTVRVTTIDSRPAAFQKTLELGTRQELVDELRSWLEVQFVGTERVVVKDPRLSWFLGPWQRCAGELGVTPTFVTMLRPPTEVLGSARQWYGNWQNDASRAAGWTNIMLHTEEQGRGSRRMFIHYDRLLTDWQAEIARLGRLIDAVDLTDVPGDRRQRVAAFVDPSLRRAAPGWDGLEVPAALQDVVDRAWAALEPLGDGASQEHALDRVRTEYDAFYADVEAIAQSTTRAAQGARGRLPKPAAAPAETEPAPAEAAPAKKTAKPKPRRRRRRFFRLPS